ncbi:MAG TPA: YihY/virulence factor BrkB family protein [Thermoanaerobaculia bacterium]|nr:YihY/virulence factor BrkB family protein [Thermoanaerobaculia bacterium]
MGKYFGLFKQTFQEFMADKVPRLGAALAYYTIFSIAPLLLIAISIAGIVFGHDAAQNQITKQLSQVLGETASKAVNDMVANAAKPKTGMIATIFGVVTLLLGASGVFGQLKDALNTIWDVEPKKSSGVFGMIKERFLSMAMVMGVGFLLLVSLVIDAGITAASDRFIPESMATVAQIVQLVLSLGIVTVLFAGIFRYLPDIRIAWHDVWFGAALTSALFVIGKFALGFYLTRSAVGSSYGAAGSLVVLLLWIYYSAQILLFGAEFTQVYARSHGSLAEETKAKATEREREKERAASAGKPEAAPAPAAKSGGGGMIKLLIGSVAGIVIGLFAGIVTMLVVVLKSVKKLILFR